MAEPNKPTVTNTRRSTPRRMLALLFTGLALLALAGGSLVMVHDCAFDPAREADACGLEFIYWWPLVMLAVWMLGGIALGFAARYGNGRWWLVNCLIGFGSWYLIGLTLVSVFPSHIIIIGMFVVINIYLITVAWRLIVTPATRR